MDRCWRLMEHVSENHGIQGGAWRKRLFRFQSNEPCSHGSHPSLDGGWGVMVRRDGAWAWSGAQFNQPALRITARLMKIARHDQVMRLRVASALLALVNMELPLAASPPIPSPFGL